MISFAATEFHLIVEGSVVFVGYHTVLFPIAVHDNCAQFHLLTTEDNQINPYTLDYGSMMMTKDAWQFMDMRCFLGWCTVAQVNLGTDRLPTDLRYSAGSDKEKAMTKDGYMSQIQLGVPAPVTATVGLQRNHKYRSQRLRFTPSNDYRQLLQQGAKDVVMVYDASQRRC